MLRGLDPQQRTAVTSDAGPLAVIAAAGSGKTTVLTRRIARRIDDGSAEASHVLALTFTRDAAGELRRRLRRLDVREPIESGTFHAVALRLLGDRALAQGRPAPVVAPDRLRLIREVLTETRRQADASAVMADIDWARARLVPPDRFAWTARDVRRRTALDGQGFVDVVTRYSDLKRRRGVVDFDDLLADALDAIRDDEQFAQTVHWRFRHLFVDEAQDLNPLQFALLEAIRAGRPDICLVGDPRQAIYGWNGADPTLLREVERVYPGVTIVPLSGNHRCSPQIVRAGAAVLDAVGMEDDSASRRPDARRVTVVACDDAADECAVVATHVRRMVAAHGPRRVAVLARTNDQLADLDRALRAIGLPVELATLRAGGRSPVDRVLDSVLRLGSREQQAAWAEGVWTSGSTDELTRRIAEEVDRWLSADVPGGLRVWIERRQPFADLDLEDPEGSVTLATFHAAKGREWEAVVVTGVEDGLVPHSSAVTPDQRAEEARLLYVALTRASDELVVTAAGTRRGAVTVESPWLRAIRASAAATDPVIAPPPGLPRRRPADDPLDALRAWRTTVARRAGIDDRAVCSDQVLRRLHDEPPRNVDDVAERLGIGASTAQRLAPALFDALRISPASA